MLTRLNASGWKGLSFAENLPPRLLLSGPNGSGKTARLEAIRYALSLPKDKAGLAPYMSGPSCQIAVGDGTSLVTRTCERTDKGDQSSYRVSSGFLPTMGEKSQSAVDARVAQTFGVDAFLLDLEGWLAQSGPERRRVLMGLCAPFAASIHPDEIVALLDEALRGNAAWPQIKAAVPDPVDAKVAPLDWLRMVEETAKGAQAQAERRKDGAEARLRTAKDNPLGMATAGKPPAQLREEIAELDGKIEEAGKVRAAAEARGRRMVAVQQELSQSQKRLPADLLGKTGENLAASYAAYVVRREEIAGKAATDAETAKAAHSEMHAAYEALARAAAGTSGRLAALMGLAEVWKPGEASACPVCGTAVEALGDAFAASLLGAKEAEEEGKEAMQAASGGILPFEMAARKARLDAESENVSLRNAQGLRTVIDRILDLEAEQAREQEDAGHLPEVHADNLVADWRVKRDSLRIDLDAVTRLEERRKLTAEAGMEADEAERSRKDAAAVAKAAGPLGVAGMVLHRMLEPILDAMAEAAPPHLAYGIRLFDERGGPDAMLVLSRGDGADSPYTATRVPYSAMSGGERAIALAALASALAKARPERKAVILVEAGEIDAVNLGALLRALRPVDASNIVVATHIEVVGDEELHGFEVRKLGGYAL